jgi:hypothetical protein
MPIDIRSEEIFSLTAATRLPCFRNRRAGKPINVSTLWRWATVGVRGIKLDTIMAGGSRSTSLEAIERFFQALTLRADTRENPVVPPRHSSQRRKQIQAAEQRLARAGV